MTDDDFETHPEFSPNDQGLGVAVLMQAWAAAASGWNPVAGVVVAAAGPIAVAFAEGRQRRAADSLAHVLDRAVVESGMAEQDFVHRALSDDQRLALVGDVMRVSYDTLYGSKLRLLARCLAEGVSDDARLDVSRLLAKVLEFLEEPHVNVLRIFVETVTPDHEGLDLGQAEGLFPFYADGMAYILSTLGRLDLLRHDGAFGSIGGGTNLRRAKWRPTTIGHDVIRRIREVQ